MNEVSYAQVDPHVSWPEMEADVLGRWAENRVFERSLEQRAGSPEWVFYEGPPTANGPAGLHHAEPRVFKDIFCRFQAMRGHYVYRKAGWDCHGLAVEIEVEKELGITQKHQIEDEIGIEEFVAYCRASVQRYVDDHRALTDRIAFWQNLDDAYWTMSPDYIETVWWLLKQIWDKGLLEEDFKVVPYCPRCETSLSSHEQHQTDAYRRVTDPSVYVRFPLVDDPNVALVVWTTTPWTLLANMAAAVGPELEYASVADPADPNKRLVLARERVEAVLGEDVDILETAPGRSLAGRRYRPPFDFVASGDAGHTVRTGDFVTTAEGTGVVHLAPYGEDDMMVAKRDGLPVVQIINKSGRVDDRGGEFAGLWFKDADPKVVDALEGSGALVRSDVYEHAYPHCWRCRTPLIYYARKDWYIRTSQIRYDLQASNDDTNWQPPTIKYGRFGDWLANNVDWSLSRDRYWGTPLPVWRCPNEHTTCVGSFAELSELADRDLSGIDPHRPYVDEIMWPCSECGEESRRVPSVIDAWFDSGAMPFGQWHYPFENEELFERRFPADFISEAIDQTRGWFYSLLAVATLVRGQNSYRNVVCLGLIVDAQGRKMSKSLGNVIDPWTVLDKLGADPMRWFLLVGGTPWSARRISLANIEEVLRKHLLTLWNTYSFFVTYAALENFDPAEHVVPVAERPEMDRWILAELDDSVREVTDALEAFDAPRGGRRIERFVDDLSNWYVRRSRRRFWRSDASAFLTLWECLVTASKLSAPYTPFVADEIFSNLTSSDPSAPDSVHLTDWPGAVDDRTDDALRRRMQLARRLVALGRAARTDARLRVRQPLRRALVVLPRGEVQSLRGLEGIVAEELNVKAVEEIGGLEDLVSYTVKPNFKSLGPRLGARVKAIAQTLAGLDPRAIVSTLESGGNLPLEMDGEVVELSPDDLDVRVEGREGFALAQDGPYGVALDVEIDDELRAEGLAREIVRAVQDLRKSSGLAVEDRIELWLASDPARAALETHEDYIATEVLAPATHINEPIPGAAAASDVEVDGIEVRIGLRPIRDRSPERSGR
jgi:isoleucyl-tRNA synthetase